MDWYKKAQETQEEKNLGELIAKEIYRLQLSLNKSTKSVQKDYNLIRKSTKNIFQMIMSEWPWANREGVSKLSDQLVMETVSKPIAYAHIVKMLREVEDQLADDSQILKSLERDTNELV